MRHPGQEKSCGLYKKCKICQVPEAWYAGDSSQSAYHGAGAKKAAHTQGKVERGHGEAENTGTDQNA